MRKHALYIQLIVLLVLVGSNGIYAQQKTVKPKPFPFGFSTKWNAVGLRFQGQDFYVSESPLEDTCNCLPQSLTSRGNAGLLISFYRNTGSRLSYSLDLGFSSGRVGTKPVPTLKSLKQNFTSFRGDIYYHFGPDFQPVSPYLHTGLHAQVGTFYASIPTGAGIRFLSRNSPTMLTAEVNYGWGVTNQLRNNLIFAFGIYKRLNSNTKQSSTPITSPLGVATPADAAACMDSDYDGVPDGSDKCPRLAGSPLNAGCPLCDTDGDGVTDDKDKCPTVPGPIQHLGCPVADTVYITKEIVRVEKEGMHIDDNPTIKGQDNLNTNPEGSAPVVSPAIKFSNGRNVIEESNYPVLDQTAVIIRNHPSLRYTVYGYSGPSKIEKLRSSEQVASVVNYLVEQQGINPGRLSVRTGLQGGTPNTVRVRAAVEGEEENNFDSPSIKKLTN